MSRPSAADSQRLDNLETASVHLEDAIEAVGILAAHLRRIYRRVPQLAHLVELADGEMARIVDDCDQARERLVAVLDAEQMQRSVWR